MSTDTSSPTRADRPLRSANGFGAALRYEWTSLRTLRSTWVLSGIAVLLQLAYAPLSGGGSSTGLDEFESGLGIAELIGAVLIAAIGVNAFGSEYRHRTIEITALTLRSPTRIVLAKSAVTAGIAAVTGLLAVLVDWLGTLTFGGKMPDPGPAATAGLGAIAYLVLSGIIGVALAGLTRHAVLALGAILLWTGGLEALLGGKLHLPEAAMPFLAAKQGIITSEPQWYLGLPLVGLTAVLLVGAIAVFSRRDT